MNFDIIVLKKKVISYRIIDLKNKDEIKIYKSR